MQANVDGVKKMTVFRTLQSKGSMLPFMGIPSSMSKSSGLADMMHQESIKSERGSMFEWKR